MEGQEGRGRARQNGDGRVAVEVGLGVEWGWKGCSRGRVRSRMGNKG